MVSHLKWNDFFTRTRTHTFTILQPKRLALEWNCVLFFFSGECVCNFSTSLSISSVSLFFFSFFLRWKLTNIKDRNEFKIGKNHYNNNNSNSKLIHKRRECEAQTQLSICHKRTKNLFAISLALPHPCTHIRAAGVILPKSTHDYTRMCVEREKNDKLKAKQTKKNSNETKFTKWCTNRIRNTARI